MAPSAPKKPYVPVSEEALNHAFNEISEGSSIRRAAKRHGIAYTTLNRHLNYRTNGRNVIMGKPTMFTAEQETALANHCVRLSALGYGLSRWQVLNLAKNMARDLELDLEPRSNSWYRKFLKRFPELKTKKPKALDKGKSCVNDKDIVNYYTELNKTLEQLGVKDNGACIYNLDETGISLDHKPVKVLTHKDVTPHSVTAGKSPTTTYIACVNAVGHTLPPYLIFKGTKNSRVTAEMRQGTIEGTKFAFSETGWSNSTLF